MHHILYLPQNSENYSCIKILATKSFSENYVTTNLEDSTRRPRLEMGQMSLTEPNAICRMIGTEELWGVSIADKSQIYQWMEFADSRLNVNASVIVFPILGVRPQNKQELILARTELDTALGCLDQHLRNCTFLCGNRVTFGDIACASALYLPFKMILDPKYRKSIVNVTRWFTTVINQPQFLKALEMDEMKLCEVAQVFDGKRYAEIQKHLKAKPVENQNVGNAGDAKPKSAAQLKKEAKKREKMEKFAAKKEKEQQKKAQPQKKVEKTEKPKAVQILYEKDTKPGEKKDVSGEIPDSYSPKYVEAAWYQWWQKMGFFKPEYGKKNVYDENPKGTFIMCLPPPNVTGKLHLGHALTNTVEDVLTRWHRMKGETTLWNPGCDHAGIATQVVVEKRLKRELGISRHDIGREDFVKEVWKWKEENGSRIDEQLRSTGSSLDWDRAFFTMDEKLTKAVKEVFVRLHEQGMIFRSKRLINWSCTLKSAISDIEVDKRDLPGRTLLSVPGYDQKIEFGVLVSFAYPIVDGNDGDEIIVATTRLETMLGDTAVAVHPEDPKYQKFHGKFVKHPFCDRKIPIIVDEMVERDFGTGAVKITPSHDPNDYECGLRHKLPFLTIISDTGDIINSGTKFDEMKRFNARYAVLDALKELGLYRGTADNPMVVPVCSRSKDIIEPLIKAQWFMDCKEPARRAVESVKRGELKLIPDAHEKTWYMWLENIRDWCISRQLWWGHRIPAYFATVDDPKVEKGEKTDGNYWFSGRDENEARAKAAKKFNVEISKITLEQDEDVLDTWFSSGLLPFSIFGWPDETPDLERFFPGTLLETGHDIIFFWVARMVMFSLQMTDKLPFTEVYFHAMVRDAHGRKMSKSLGNVIDPTDVIDGTTLEQLHKSLENGNLDPREIEKAKSGQKADYPNGIPECGSDALRFALCAYTCQGRNINLDVNRILGYRHFCNKLWNAVKFATKSLGQNFQPWIKFDITKIDDAVDLWILNKLSRAIKICENGLKKYQFPEVTTAVYNFWLYELCDVYLECLKPVFFGTDARAIETSKNTLYTCLETALRLTSPLMPYISEELWQRLPRRGGDNQPPSVMVADWPAAEDHDWVDDEIDSNMEFVSNVVKVARSLRADYNLTKTKVDLYVRCSDDASASAVNKFSEAIKTLSYSSKVEILKKREQPPVGCAVAIVNDKCDVNLMLKGVIDLEKEMAKLQKKRAENDKKICALEAKMAKSEYKSKVPENVQKADAEKLQQSRCESEKMLEAEKNFATML